MKILIGYDGSRHADAALNDLALAGVPAKAEALVVSFVPRFMFTPEGDVLPDFKAQSTGYRNAFLKEARSMAEGAAVRLCERFPGWKVKAAADREEPAKGILDKAGKWKPDLIVVGSHGRTAISRLFLGSVSGNILHHSLGDVRIVRPRIRNVQGPPRILIGVDGSRGSDAALAAVASRTWPRRTSARVVGALGARRNPVAVFLDGSREFEARFFASIRDRIMETVSNAVERLAEAGLDVEPAVLAGDPRKVLLKEARNWNADTIFVGCRGLGAMDRFLIGSVSSAVASHAPCTVEVIRKHHPFPRKT